MAHESIATGLALGVARNRRMRVALHKHPGVADVVEAAAEILTMVPGIELVDLNQPAVGLQSVNVSVLPKFKRELQLLEFEAARDAGVDALVAVHHSDHCELCAHERDWPFRIINILEVVGESMGLHLHDRYKELKIMQDADQIVTDCSDLIAKHSLDPRNPRDVVVKVLLGDQPALKDGTLLEQRAGVAASSQQPCGLLLAQNDELLATDVCFSVKRTSRRPVTASGLGTNRTTWRGLMMSVDRGRPEVAG